MLVDDVGLDGGQVVNELVGVRHQVQCFLKRSNSYSYSKLRTPKRMDSLFTL